MRRLSLRARILLAVSGAVVFFVLLAGWLVQRHAVNTATQVVEAEVESSFQAYESLWNSRARLLGTASLLLSTMSDVRAAFSTGDAATIQDTAGELWARISDSTAFFLVADPTGHVIASLGGASATPLPEQLPVVENASSQFPEQASGFLQQDGQSFQVVVTPVYVQSDRSPLLLNVLVAGYRVDETVLSQLKEATGGSDFLFASADQVLVSTLPEGAELLAHLRDAAPGDVVTSGDSEYATLRRELVDVSGEPVAELWIFRSFQDAQQQIAGLRRDILLILVAALLAGLLLAHLLARRILGPIDNLDRAATEIAHQNYDVRVPVDGDDELGRLARTFNDMCGSIQAAREELILTERISTIGNMATSIIHDLRNPLAAIYGGSEMLVDSDLPQPTVKRLAGNIYRASRNIQTMLTDLRNLSRDRTNGTERCSLRDVVTGGLEPLSDLAGRQNVEVVLDVAPDIEVTVERGRVERVFTNLLANALDAMPGGGKVSIRSRVEDSAVLVEFNDSGPGISADVRERLFQPFSGTSKKNGMGLGLALSRQTMLDHAGDLWAEARQEPGAKFVVKLPLAGQTDGLPGENLKLKAQRRL